MSGVSTLHQNTISWWTSRIVFLQTAILIVARNTLPGKRTDTPGPELDKVLQVHYCSMSL